VTEPIARKLAEFAVTAEPSGRPGLLAIAARHLLDVIGCGLAAVGTGDGGHATEVALAAGGNPDATVLGSEVRLPAAAAALANGTRFHALDFDDTHEEGICHVSAVVVPAALASAEVAGLDLGGLLDALAVGSEVALRIAVASAPSIYARGFHPTSVCGAFGATAAVARVRGLDPAQTANALGIVGSFASGLMEYLSDGSATKPLHAGWAAQAGVQAAALAAAGATGPATILEGRFGIFASHGEDPIDPAPVTAGLGTDWHAERIAIKPFPACHFLHAPTWAVAQLAAEHGFGADDVESIAVEVPAPGVPLVLEPFAAKHHPATVYDAKFSAPWTIAHHLVHGELTLTSFSAERIADPRLLDLAGRIGGGAWTDGEPPSRFCGAVTVTAGGAELREVVPFTPGSPGNPLSDAAVLDKFRANAALALPPEEVDALADAISADDGATSLEPILEPLRRARPRPAS
jgi:2-methylcitrate dehydratase PrpD